MLSWPDKPAVKFITCLLLLYLSPASTRGGACGSLILYLKSPTTKQSGLLSWDLTYSPSRLLYIALEWEQGVHVLTADAVPMIFPNKDCYGCLV